MSPILFFANEQYFLPGPSFPSVLDAVEINYQQNVPCESLRAANPIVCCQKCHIILVSSQQWDFPALSD